MANAGCKCNVGPVCKGNHNGHLCVLVSKGKFDKIREMVDDAKFICFNCGRAANCEDNLCNPMRIEK